MQAGAGLLAQLALWVGQHALPLYFVMLWLLLAVTYACWWAFQRTAVPRDETVVAAPLTVLPRSAIGFAIIVIGAGVFAELAEQLGAGDACARRTWHSLMR
ncbi:MAG: hypothetical protein WBM03_04975 [Steroidobacteraceae bacterium]